MTKNKQVGCKDGGDMVVHGELGLKILDLYKNEKLKPLEPNTDYPKTTKDSPP